METDLVVLENVVDRMKEIKFGYYGELYGFRSGSNIYAVTFIIKEDENKKHQKYKDVLPISANNFPNPIKLIGLVYGAKTAVDNQFKKDFGPNANIRRIHGVLKVYQPVIIAYEYGDDIFLFFRYLRSSFVGTSNDIIPDRVFWRDFIHYRLSAGLHYQTNSEKEIDTSYLDEKIAEVDCGDAEFKCSDIRLNGHDDGQYRNKRWEDVIANCGDNNISVKFTVHGEERHVLQVEMELADMCRCVNFNPDASAFYTGCYTHRDNPENHNDIKNDPILYNCLIIDCLMFANKSHPFSVLYELMKDSASRLLKLTYDHYLTYKNPMQVYHFHIPQIDFWFTTLFPINVPDKELAEIRDYYHYAFNLPRTEPIFTRGKSFVFRISQDTPAILKNVHVGLKPSGMKGGEISLVKGPYEYYHYKQLNMDDSGWGCAYRSLQTIYSWYRLQGWSDKPVPTHLQIQQILVNIGDKQKDFVGSRRWIGSFEVSYVLDSLLGVTCRMLTVQKGDSISSLAYEVANHFQTHGSPIMIGGGVLAHTIIGVQVDELTDESRFLILDPHYIGTDSVGSVQNKNGVAWKKPDFWKKDTFYNLCLPFKKSGF